MKKYVILGVLCLIATAVITIYLFSGKDAIQYRTGKIDRGTISKYITATGTVNPVRTVIIGSQVSGLVSQLFVDFNSEVKKGQVVARIDPVPFELGVKRAEASLATAVATHEKAKVTAKNNRSNYHRAKKLFEKKVISIEELDAVRTTFEVSTTDVELAEAQVLQAKAALEIAKTDLEHTVITSPLNGIVISREVDVGQTVVASFQTPTLFTLAEDLVHMQVNANIDEADIGMVKIKQYAKFTVDAFPDDTFEGTVVEIRKNPVIFQNVVTYNTIISFDNSSLKLLPGMTASTSILVAKAENVLKVPNVSLRYTPSEVLRKEAEAGEHMMTEKKFSKKNGQRIWILEQGKLKEVFVKLGISDDSYTEILEGDLKEGQEVVIDEVTLKPTSTDTKQRVPWRGRF